MYNQIPQRKKKKLGRSHIIVDDDLSFENSMEEEDKLGGLFNSTENSRYCNKQDQDLFQSSIITLNRYGRSDRMLTDKALGN